MLSLPKFDANILAPSIYPGTASQSGDYTILSVVQFGAQPNESLPLFLASFAHPVHVDWTLNPDMDADTRDDEGLEWLETDVLEGGLETQSCHSLDPDHKPE